MHIFWAQDSLSGFDDIEFKKKKKKAVLETSPHEGRSAVAIEQHGLRGEKVPCGVWQGPSPRRSGWPILFLQEPGCGPLQHKSSLIFCKFLGSPGCGLGGEGRVLPVAWVRARCCPSIRVLLGKGSTRRDLTAPTCQVLKNTPASPTAKQTVHQLRNNYTALTPTHHKTVWDPKGRACKCLLTRTPRCLGVERAKPHLE